RLTPADLTGDFSTVYRTPYHNSQSASGGVPFQSHPLQYWTLTYGSTAINSGAVLPNVNDPYVRDGSPDRGAYESGQSYPYYGARATLPWMTASSGAVYLFNGSPLASTLTISSGTVTLLG